MPKLSKYVPIPIQGLDTSGPSPFIDDRATPDCQNIRIRRTEVKKREGFTVMGSSASGMVQYIIEHQRGGTRKLCRITTKKFQVWNNSTATWTDYTGGTDLQGSDTIPVSATITKISNKNVLVFTNYVDNIKKWVDEPNDIADLGGSPPIAKYLLHFEGYLLAAYIKDGSDIYPERVQWPDTDDPENWTIGSGSNAGYNGLQDGYEITGLVRLVDLVVICKEGSIWNGYLTGDSRIFQFEQMESKMGFLVGNTVKNIPGNRLIGLSKHGIITYNGRSASMVAYGILDDIRDYINPQYVARSFGVVVSELNEYWLFIPTIGNYPTIVYKVNYITGQVHKDTCSNLTAAGLREQLEPTTINSLTNTINSYTGVFNHVLRTSLYPAVIVGDKDGYCYKFDYNSKNDNGTAIDAYWCSKDYAPQLGRYCSWVQLDFEAYGDSVDVYYSTDEGQNYTLIDSVTLSSTVSKHTLYFDVLSEKLRIKFANSNSGETFTLRDFTLWYIPREEK